jgi:ribosome-binding ATPase YchF (GTP1/OBG family)
MLADIETLEKMLPKLEKEAKADKKAATKLKGYQGLLSELRSGKVSPELLQFARDEKLPLLSAKPVIYVFNVDELTLIDQLKRSKLASLVAPAESLFVSAKLEEDLAKLSDDEKQEFLDSYGIAKTGLDQLIKAAYKTLGLQSYLTAGKKEVRAWTIKQGSTAPQAAGVIHTDFERGFIAAQVANYDDLINAGSEANAKATGKIRTEGKDYVMRPNDVVEFRFNV